MHRLLVLVAAVALLAPPSAPTPAAPAALGARAAAVLHRPPVPGPVIDGFRPPPEPWLAGNRGIEYETEPGEPVRATADGVVVFAGAVAGSLHVTIRHDDHLVTTLAFVAEIEARVGDRVRAGDVVARAGESIHFTARADGEYIDPSDLFVPHAWVVRLIPDH